MVRPPRRGGGGGRGPEQGDHGHTMVYSTAARVQEELPRRGAERRGRAMLVAEGKRMPIGPGGAVIGRSRECDIVLEDSNVSRRHAELRPDGRDGWTMTDLGLDERRQGQRSPVASGRGVAIAPGDHLDIGTVDVRFEVQ